MSNELKVNLTLLKRYVAELEASINKAETVMANKEDPNDYVVEMSKSAGLASGIVQEATLLVGDIKTAIKLNTAYQQAAGSIEGDLADLFSLGGSGKPDAN